MSKRQKKIDYSRPPTEDEMRRAQAKLTLLKPKLLREYTSTPRTQAIPDRKINKPSQNQMDYQSYLDDEDDYNPNKYQNNKNNNKNNNNNNNKPRKQEYQDEEYEQGSNRNNKMENSQHQSKRNNPPVQNNEQELPDEFAQIETFECPEGCGRKFAEKVLAKHVKICAKLATKRKAFDPQAQRIINEEQASNVANLKRNEKKLEADRKAKAHAKKLKWKQESEKFRSIMKQAKGEATQEDIAILEKVQKQEQASLTQCPHCQRKFNDAAAKKHIPFCATKAQQNKFKKKK